MSEEYYDRVATTNIKNSGFDRAIRHLSQILHSKLRS